MKSFHILTFGCQMNEHDSERMTGILEAQGFSSTQDAGRADLIIVNTCSIREKAEQKFFSELGRLKHLKDERPGLTIAVAGCIAQQEGSKILSRAPYVDIVFGPSDITKLAGIIGQKTGRVSQIVDTSGDPQYHLKSVPTARADRLKAWVSIMYGCDNFCTYCVVPYLRGRERSRPVADILTEVKGLALNGYKEVTLLGQNVNSYGKGLQSETDFPALLSLINDIPGLERIRFVTSHPRDLSDGLIMAIRDLPKVCEALHLPVQSGSNAILKAMNRRYTRDEYLEKIKRLRHAVPDIALTTDIIVGFPGETSQDFAMTLQLLEEVRYDAIFAFKYSERPGTAALKLPGHLSESVKEERLAQVLALQNTITAENSRNNIGRTKEILIDGRSKRGGNLAGRTRGNKVVHVDASDDYIGSLAQVRIIDSGVNALIGQLCE